MIIPLNRSIQNQRFVRAYYHLSLSLPPLILRLHLLQLPEIFLLVDDALFHDQLGERLSLYHGGHEEFVEADEFGWVEFLGHIERPPLKSDKYHRLPNRASSLSRLYGGEPNRACRGNH